LTQYPQKELIYLSNKDKIILAYQIKDWRHALSWGYEKLCDVFLEKNDETSILQAFELAISLKYYHNVKYLNDRFGSFYQTEIISTLLQCKQYNWHTLNYYLSISNFSEIVQKRILISAAIVNDNVDYLENCAFTDFEYRKIIKYNSFRVYSKYCCYKSLLKDWSYAVKYSAYEIIFIIKNLLFHQPFVISCQEELLQALHKTKFNCYALAYFFLAENNSQIVKNYRLSDNLEIRQQEIRILNYLSNIPKAFETDEMKY
jgi:hypothetical protein